MEGQRRCWQRRRSALEKWRGAILAPTTVTDQNAHLLNSPPASPETFLPTHPPTDPPTHLVLPGSPCRPDRPRSWLSMRRDSCLSVPTTWSPPSTTTSAFSFSVTTLYSDSIALGGGGRGEGAYENQREGGAGAVGVPRKSVGREAKGP